MTEQNKESQRPDAVPASLSEGAVEAKYKKGDHVWANRAWLFKAMDFPDYEPRKGFRCREYFNS